MAPAFLATKQTVAGPGRVAMMVNDNNITHRADAYYRALQTRNLTATGLTVVGSEFLAGQRARVCSLLVCPMNYTDPVTKESSITSFATMTFSWSEARARAGKPDAVDDAFPPAASSKQAAVSTARRGAQRLTPLSPASPRHSSSSTLSGTSAPSRSS